MRRTGQVISVTATKQTFGLGDPQDLFTLCNDSTSNALYYRGTDPSTFAGNDATLIGLGANKLDAGEKITVKGGAYDFVCATGQTASCRVLYGNSSSAANVSISATADIGNVNLLDSEGGSVISPATETTLSKATTARTSVLYNGGGTANALQEPTTTSAIPTNSAVIAVGTNNVLELCLFDATAAETVTVSLAEYSAASPTIATLIRQVSVPTGSDLARTVDRACVGLTTGTEIYAKAPVRITVTPGSYVVLSVLENITGAAYVRYQLLGSV